jgi:hypothetical protein
VLITWGPGLSIHISQMAPCTYNVAHRHGPGATIVILSGEGYSLMGRGKEAKDRMKIDWREGIPYSSKEETIEKRMLTSKAIGGILSIVIVALLIFFLVPVVWMDTVPCTIFGFGYASLSYYFFHYGFAYVHSQYAYLTPVSFNCI